ncbi:hypothetical protein GEMMAAP_18070 [Gemmatimonas phototrophica]|uniref:Uncharacterized protein n=1 Tax=Gemmatimonas phototrophica TaxID=1379270 RepID=A0A143BMA2_9BACT|nr:hypothetical protein GEMMAAP_18070 [Gemmatimonas phototrophica]
MANDLTSLSTHALRAKLKSTQAIQRTVAGIIAAIVLAWIVLGYWRTNTPVFISTMAMGIAAIAATSTAPRAVQAEIARRDAAA